MPVVSGSRTAWPAAAMRTAVTSAVPWTCLSTYPEQPGMPACPPSRASLVSMSASETTPITLLSSSTTGNALM
jgi:hypothetical protein